MLICFANGDESNPHCSKTMKSFGFTVINELTRSDDGCQHCMQNLAMLDRQPIAVTLRLRLRSDEQMTVNV